MKKKIIFFANHAAFFISHRVNIFLEAKKKGYDFLLIIGKGSSNEMENIALKKLKFYRIPHKILNFNSHRFNILNDLCALLRIYFIIKKFKPNIFHTVAPKPNLYGGFLSTILSIKKTVISFSGMGFLFTGNLSIKNFFKKFFYLIILKFIFLNKKLIVVVQNNDDYKFLMKKFNLKKNIKLIKGGSGIDIKKFTRIKRKNNKNIVFSARLVRNKGINEFIRAAKKLKKNYPEWNFLIYGASDYKSHDSFNLENHKDEIKKKIIIYKGYKTNIPKILTNTEIFCLPSYREGLPKSVLEAAASGIPCVVSNAVGLKESVINNKTGLLFKNKSYIDLANKLEYLMVRPKKRNLFSLNARNFVKNFASINSVTREIFKIYESNG